MCLGRYWFYRALDAFLQSGRAEATIGRPENHEANRLAYLRALRTRLQLRDVYGIAETMSTDGGEAREETQRIEAGLAQAFTARGFAVALNWQPDRALHGDAGEVDLICAMDGIALVIEVKSTFIRKSHKEAFQHAANTLRHAGRQVSRKAQAVVVDLRGADALRQAMRLPCETSAAAPRVIGWIVDTSIECDHQRFLGALKVSLEEVLIALRDDAALLRDPANLFMTDPKRAPGEEDTDVARHTLYPNGFSARRFVEVIE